MALAFDEKEYDDDEFIKCRICLSEYDEETRKPKFLPCSHTLCLPCIESIETHAETLLLLGDKQFLLCPFCRSVFLPLDLPNNVYALQMLKEKHNKIADKLLDVSERSLKNMLKVHKEIDSQLAKKMSFINLDEEKTRKLIDENNSQITILVGLLKNPSFFPNGIATSRCFSENLLSKFILKLFKNGRLKGEIHIRPAPTFYPEFVRELGEFCYRSPKEFCRSLDKAMPGVFVLFPMLHPKFVPVVPSMTEHMDSWTAGANDMDEVGITLIKSLDNKITHWSFIFILEDKKDFLSHDNLPKTVTDNELFGHVIHHHMLESLIRLSLSSKTDRSNYLMTLESQ